MNKEEIEKAKEKTKNWINDMKTGMRIEIVHKGDILFCDDLETLLQYIDQLEQENNKQNKIIDEMTKYMVNEVMYEADLDKIYGEMYNTYGEERNWMRGNEEEVKMLKQYFEKKVEEK